MRSCPSTTQSLFDCDSEVALSELPRLAKGSVGGETVVAQVSLTHLPCDSALAFHVLPCIGPLCVSQVAPSLNTVSQALELGLSFLREFCM